MDGEWSDIVRLYAEQNPPRAVNILVDDLRTWLADPTRSQLSVLESSFEPKSVGLTDEQWAADVVELLDKSILHGSAKS